ncbi:uncharacterized protein LOC108239883 isoform X2 [Kryptolebias marmoratus]|uniref:uncharacterized protein LOC108239883 isoform X2 n=1 Tax=Kryptolebias marmoratus TaxID=37003 RepID=UPI0007F87899|nr:uncharacterized protein LOC108239883 isoform X2 [Kryptolebias marmoratus]
MNPESLDLSIQSALSALFPPFEATAPIVLSQLFRTIDEQYHGDALQCLLDFLIPSKHLLESVQQAACAGFSDVVFRCEGWPLCLHDRTVIQLASVNPLLLRPGDFYLQVEPFGDQAARIVLKTLLEEGCREVEETPIPETSYPCLFTEDWLQDVNEGRQGTPLSRCLLCTDQGVIKLPWAKIAIPEFLDKPKIMPTCGKAPPEPRRGSASFHFNSSTLPVEAVIPSTERKMSASLRHSSSKLIKMEQERQTPKSVPKPVGWVSPNTWESLNYREIEGDYVDLVDIAKEKELVDRQRDNHASLPNLVLVKPVRPPPSIPLGNTAPCGRSLQYTGELCLPFSQRNLEQELTDQDLKCRYRDSYVAALRNPVTFERGNVDLLSTLEEAGLCEEGDAAPRETFEARNKDHIENLGNHCERAVISNKPCQFEGCCHLPFSCESKNLMKESSMILKSASGLNHSDTFQTALISKQLGHCAHPVSDVSSTTSDGNSKLHQKWEVVKPSGKHKVKVRSLSTVSETPTGSPALYKLNNRSQSDVCPETITSIIQQGKGVEVDQEAAKVEKQRCWKKDSHSNRGETPSSINGLGSKLPNSKTENQSSSQVQLPGTSSDSQQPPQTKESAFGKISNLLKLGIICLPGSRDKNGRAVVEVYGDRKEWTSPLVSAQSVCELLLYLHSIPSRKDVRELGMTLVINARKKLPPLHLYKALLMAQEQALHAVHSIVILTDKDCCPRPEKHPGLQIDLVTSTRALNKTVEASQLTSELGGTFIYNHSDWLQFHQKLVPFMADLRGANGLLQNAIKKVDSRKQMDTAQEVQQSIQEQRVLMKEVLEDAGLVTLQKEGGTLLARMKKEEFRFPQSEDYRDALETVTSLYNQVEEKLHMLVMRSNESLQQLEFLLKLREMEAKIISAGIWFSSEGEQSLKSSYTTNDTAMTAEKVLRNLNLFLKTSKEKQQHALSLVAEAEKLVGNSSSCPATDIFRTLVGTFRSNVDDFMLRAEQKKKELDSLVQMYSFCEKVTALAKECGNFLAQVEEGCLSAETLTTLQLYQERLDGEFSPRHFQALKAKTCAMVAGASQVMGVWNAAWIRSQEVKQRLEEMKKKKKKGIDKKQIQQTTAANPPGKHGETKKEGERSELGEAESSLMLSQKEVNNAAESPKESINVACCKHNIKTDLKETENQGSNAQTQAESAPKTPVLPEIGNYPPESKWRPREHHSEADLRSLDSTKDGEDFPSHQNLGRSLSEGMCVINFSSLSPLNISPKHCHSKKHSLDQNLPPSKNHHVNLWPENLNCEPKREEEDEGCMVSATSPEMLKTSETLLSPTESNGSNVLTVQKILEELLSTEREYVQALGYVREHYFPELERADVPQDLRGQRGSIFGNLEKLHDFHRHHFLDELESCMAEPFRVGRSFLRHRESFALYALYSKNKPQSDRLLINHGKTFFKQKQLKLGDKMDLWSYLLKPVQRISKYSLLLQDVMRECGPEQSREIAEIKAALEVIHFQLRHGNNLLAMDAIRNCDVNLKEQGQLIRQDELLVTFRKKKCFRHIFLFQELILFSKTRKTDVGNDTYVYKQSFKTCDIGMTQNSGDSGLCFEIWFRKRKSQDTYTLQAVSRETKEAWTKDLERILWEQAIHNREVRMQERVFLGIGNKPFMDIQPSEAAISDRAINCALIGRETKLLSSVRSCGSHGELPAGRPKSVGSGSSSSSSSSSGRGSLSPVGYAIGPKRRVVSAGLPGYVSPSGALEEDDMDHECGNQNLLLDSSESSGESVSGFSSSSHSYQSAVGEMEDNSSVCASIITVKEVGAAHATEASTVIQKADALPGSAVKKQPQVAPKLQNQHQCQNKDLPCSKTLSTNVKSTEV